MLIFQGIFPRHAPPRDRVITIGNFDGVHLGHQALIDQAVGLARERGLCSTVVTFEPHPKAFFAPEQAPKKIQGLRAKALALADHGVDELRILKFRRALAQMPAEAFMQTVLHQSLRAQAIVVGDDFCFGAKRRGTIAMLRDAAVDYGWSVHPVATILNRGARASSSALRDVLARGDLAAAAVLMGRPYDLAGHVIHGRKIGRSIGFPTLNVAVPANLLLSGVFVVSVEGLAETPLPAVASLGHRPTTEHGGRLLLEVHVFDWSGNAYGKCVRVIFHEKLRGEEKFQDVAAMTDQIQRDAARARHYFSHHVH
jgi:riboflavin kinase / FMN adenylyltransferase